MSLSKYALFYSEAYFLLKLALLSFFKPSLSLMIPDPFCLSVLAGREFPDFTLLISYPGATEEKRGWEYSWPCS
jgi:hypothetical protein